MVNRPAREQIVLGEFWIYVNRLHVWRKCTRKLHLMQFSSKFWGHFTGNIPSQCSNTPRNGSCLTHVSALQCVLIGLKNTYRVEKKRITSGEGIHRLDYKIHKGGVNVQVWQWGCARSSWRWWPGWRRAWSVHLAAAGSRGTCRTQDWRQSREADEHSNTINM